MGSSARLAALSAGGVFRRGFTLALRRATVFRGSGRAALLCAGGLFFAYGQGITKRKEGKKLLFKMCNDLKIVIGIRGRNERV
jgi:hypothetical protein